MANSCKPIFVSNAEIMIHFKNESSSKGGRPLPGSLLALNSAEHLGPEQWPVYMWSFTERNRTMLFRMHTLSKQGLNLYNFLEHAFKEFQA